MIFPSVVSAVLVSAALIWLARWARREYRDFCELRLWAIAVNQEATALKAAAASKKKV